MRHISVLRCSVVLVFAWYARYSYSSQSGSAPNVAHIRSLIQKKMSEEHIPSIAVAVAKNGKIIWEEAFGLADQERQTAATVHTSYYVASVSKSITSTALMTLVARKQLNLDAPANDYLGRAKLHSPQWDVSAATLRRVATHRWSYNLSSKMCGR